jgi:hypothetical protein
MPLPATLVIRLFLLVEAATYVVAAAVHFGTSDSAAAVAETAIAVVLLSGWSVTWKRPASTPTIGLAAQAFAFLFTLVGIYTIAIGIGPRSIPDIVYHLGIVAVLAWGIAVANRARPAAQSPPG